LTSATGRTGQRLALGAEGIMRFAYRKNDDDEAERF
jgi:hypothetical protein